MCQACTDAMCVCMDNETDPAVRDTCTTVYAECSTAIVSQMNMIANFAAHAAVGLINVGQNLGDRGEGLVRDLRVQLDGRKDGGQIGVAGGNGSFRNVSSTAAW